MQKPEFAAWRALVDKELAGGAFDKLVQMTAEGIAIQPLYAERGANPGVPGAAPFVRGAKADATRFQIAMRVDPASGRRAGALDEDLDGGAEALWFAADDAEARDAATRRGALAIVDGPVRMPHAWCGYDPFVDLNVELATAIERIGEAPGLRTIRVSSLAIHAAGADPADELASMLSMAAAYLRVADARGVAISAAAQAMWAQVAIGRDTFGEVCKLRALRWLWHKLFAAAGHPDVALDAIHAVCASRTQSQRDPWVNMLRTTTQVFAAAAGGAQVITPAAFDEALGAVSPLGRRVARNTALVLREESQLGRVIDPAGGSYYVEARTEALAREAWSRFRAIERDGGILPLLASGRLRERFAASWAKRSAAIHRRKEAVLGVSEFANLDEKLPAPIPAPGEAPPSPALVVHRDGEAFEALRTRAEHAGRVVALELLGPPAEHRARAGYAEAFFATAGLRATAGTASVPARDIVCICGTDERYAAEAADRARALRDAGARRVVLAGRPGALEAALREAGVETFIFVGCDVLATLEEVLQ